MLSGLIMKPLGCTKWQLVGCTVFMTVFLAALASANQYRERYGIAVGTSTIVPKSSLQGLIVILVYLPGWTGCRLPRNALDHYGCLGL
jgi:hypothetical protein